MPSSDRTMGDMGDVRLRDVIEADVSIFFDQQLDPDGIRMVAFTRPDHADRGAFVAKWARILADDTSTKRTILFNGEVAGNVVCFEHLGKPSIGYWLGKSYWGKGIATRALAQFLRIIPTRPLYAGVAKDNLGSLRVLENCGFTICGENKGFSHSRGVEVEETLLVLQDRPV